MSTVNGFYECYFENADDASQYGFGAVRLEDWAVKGGDVGYHYAGSYTQSGETLDFKLVITRTRFQQVNVLGDIDTLYLFLKGTVLTTGEIALEGAHPLNASKRIKVFLQNKKTLPV